MAAAIIPIIAQVVPLVLPTIVKLVEGLFPPKTGDTKKATAVDLTKVILEKTAAAGITGPVPDDNTLGNLVETVVQDLKARGELSAPPGQRANLPLVKKLLEAAVEALG